MNAYLNLGTNIGDRLANLEQAVALIEYFARTRCRLSSVIESEPWGFYSTHMFLNIGVSLAWDRSPFELLSITQRVERIMGSANHRDSNGRYMDRLIDIDIITIDSVRMSTPRLTLPHPRAMMRPFVTEPLRQLGFNF